MKVFVVLFALVAYACASSIGLGGYGGVGIGYTGGLSGGYGGVYPAGRIGGHGGHRVVLAAQPVIASPVIVSPIGSLGGIRSYGHGAYGGSYGIRSGVWKH